MRTRGWAARNSAIQSIRNQLKKSAGAATRNVPLACWLPSMKSCDACASASICSAQRAYSVRPASVSASLRVERCIRRAPKLRSSSWMRRLIVFGGEPSRRAASAKLPARTTWTNSATSFKSIIVFVHFWMGEIRLCHLVLLSPPA